MSEILYVYAIGRAGHPLPADIAAVESGALAAFYSLVDYIDYNQAVIDARSKDVEWLGAIGYRHQSVMTELMRGGTIIPLRAFTLFANEERLRAHLDAERDKFDEILTRLDGKQEWTLRIEFEPARWNEALTSRVDSLRTMMSDIGAAAPGRAFLLKKKLEDERKKASRDAELQVVAEIEKAVLDKLRCETVAESREARDGAFPQINVLLNRDEESILQELYHDLSSRYASEGITLAISGPWPPYTFASVTNG